MNAYLWWSYCLWNRNINIPQSTVVSAKQLRMVLPNYLIEWQKYLCIVPWIQLQPTPTEFHFDLKKLCLPQRVRAQSTWRKMQDNQVKLSSSSIVLSIITQQTKWNQPHDCCDVADICKTMYSENKTLFGISLSLSVSISFAHIDWKQRQTNSTWFICARFVHFYLWVSQICTSSKMSIFLLWCVPCFLVSERARSAIRVALELRNEMPFHCECWD